MWIETYFSNFTFDSNHLVHFLIIYVVIFLSPILCSFTFDRLFPLPILMEVLSSCYRKLWMRSFILSKRPTWALFLGQVKFSNNLYFSKAVPTILNHTRNRGWNSLLLGAEQLNGISECANHQKWSKWPGSWMKMEK